MPTVVRRIAILLIAALAAGCVGPAAYEKLRVEEIVRRVEVQDSEFDRQRTIVGPRIFEPVGLFANQEYRLRGWVRKDDGTQSHQLYVTITYSLGGWMFFEQASFLVGEPRRLDVISRDVGFCDQYGCMHSETVGVTFDRAYLEGHRASGVRIRIDARSGAKTVVTLPANYIAAYLAVVDAQKVR